MCLASLENHLADKACETYVRKSPPIIIFGIQLMRRNVLAFNPLSPNSEQHQFSPNNIHTMLKGKVMRINKMIA